MVAKISIALLLIPHYFAVSKMYLPLCEFRNIRLVGHQNYGNAAVLIQVLHNIHNFSAGLGVKIPGWLISKDKRGIIYQGPGYGPLKADWKDYACAPAAPPAPGLPSHASAAALKLLYRR
jgi:hypothetical protein